ncbi:MAG TPA: hypothetical protein DCG51_11925 [Erysipelotrichaceae bacterium]|nr:hypothetical protein [Erysipelotrichaceae bacterium]
MNESAETESLSDERNLFISRTDAHLQSFISLHGRTSFRECRTIVLLMSDTYIYGQKYDGSTNKI